MNESPGGVGPPTVTRLFTTPIKGFALGQPDSVTLERNGAVGDRDFFVIDSNQQLLSITRTGAFGGWQAQFDRDQGVLTLTSPDGRVLEDKVVKGADVVVNFWDSHEVRATSSAVLGRLGCPRSRANRSSWFVRPNRAKPTTCLLSP